MTTRIVTMILFAVLFGVITAPVALADDLPPLVTMERFRSCKQCESYELRILADGTVIYTGKAAVHVIGTERTKVDQDKIRGLLAEFERIGFSELREEYLNPRLHDVIKTRITLHSGDSVKAVTFQAWGGGAPPSLFELSKKIDEIVNSRRWTLGN